MGFVGNIGDVAKVPKPGAELPVASRSRRPSFPEEVASYYDKQPGVAPELRRTEEELQASQEVPSYFANTTEGEANFEKAGYARTLAGLHDLGIRVKGAERPFSEQVTGQEAGSVSGEQGQEPDWSRLSPEALATRHEMVVKNIGDLRARQMALDDALDAPSIQELSRVNQELKAKEAMLASLGKFMGS